MSEISNEYGWDASMGISSGISPGISLHDKIRRDMKDAMIKKNPLVRDTMRLIIGAFPSLTVSMTLESGKKTTRVKKAEEITDDDLLGIIRKFVKSEKTVLEFKKETTSDYLELLNTYLPRMATLQEIELWVRENVDLSRFNSPIQAMGTVMKHYGKLADGNQVKEVLKNMGTA
jgi:uncharacterized protein YqeY